MQFLPSTKVIARDEMSRALLRAGQFAHIAECDLEETLNELYSLPRARVDRSHRDQMEEAVPKYFVELVNGTGHERVYRAKETVEYIRHKHGCICHLCWAVSYWTLFGDDCALTRMVAPFLLRTSPDEAWVGCMCDECSRQVSSLYRGKNFTGEGWIDDEDRVIAGLAVLLKRETFRSRVYANRKRRLRFNPRTGAPNNPPANLSPNQ